MGHDLTRRYESAFEHGTVSSVVRFAQDVYAFDKVRELSSFAVWEARHRLHLFPKNQYLTFTEDEPVTLGDATRVDAGSLAEPLAAALGRAGQRVSACVIDWRVMFLTRVGTVYGSLASRGRDLYEGTADGDSARALWTFPGRVKSVFESSRGTLLICITGVVFRSTDRGASFEKVLTLGPPDSFWPHNNAIAETPDGTLILGEYGNVRRGTGWTPLAFLYVSTDDGATWTRSEFLIERGTNKHVHVVRYSAVLGRVLVADGDNHKKLWLSRRTAGGDLADGPGWTAANRFHIQMGGYTAAVETGGRLLFGTDYQGGTNFLVESADGRTFRRQIVPDPYRRSPIDNMVLRRSRSGDEIWANLPYSTTGTKALLMFSADGGRRWQRVIEYCRKAQTVSIVSSSTAAVDRLFISIVDTATQTRGVYRIGDR